MARVDAGKRCGQPYQNVSSNVSLAELSNRVPTGHTWLLFKSVKNKQNLKHSSPVRLATFEVLNNCMWLVAAVRASTNDRALPLLLEILLDSPGLGNCNNGPNICAQVNPFLELRG